MKIEPQGESMFYVRQLLNPQLCQQIIQDYHDDSGKRCGATTSAAGKTTLQTAIKRSTDLEIPQGGPWRRTFDELNIAVRQVFSELRQYVPALQVWSLQWTGYKIQHYRRNEGHFKWHFDAIGPGTWDRQLAIIIYLNSVASGGETCFYSQKLEVRPSVGDALLFPTFWTHAHCGRVPKSDDKYIISSFVSFSNPALMQKTA